MSHVVTVTDQDFATSVEQQPGLTVVDVWATWCGPCRMIAPMLDAIAAERAGQLRVAKLNSDENVQTAARFNVRSLPTLLFFRDGELVDRVVGALPRPRIEERIEGAGGITDAMRSAWCALRPARALPHVRRVRSWPSPRAARGAVLPASRTPHTAHRLYMEYTLLRSYGSDLEAELARAVLEANGIQAVVRRADAAGLLRAVQPADLLVPEDAVDDAEALLEEGADAPEAG